MNKIENDVGLIIPVYNRPNLIINTLDSVAKQTVLPGQVIVIDDGSTDNTAKVVEAWIKDIKIPLNISLVSTVNGGASAARNYGLKRLQETEFVAFLDSDDMWPEKFIEHMTQYLKEKHRACAISCDRLCIDTKDNSQYLFQVVSIQYDPISFMLKRGAGLFSCSIFRRKFIFEAGTFNESIKTGEDAALLLPLALLGPWLFLPIDPVISITHNIHNEDANKHAKYPDAMLIWGNIFDAFISQVDSEYPKLRKWKLKLSSRWYFSGSILLKRFLFAESLYCFNRAVFWLFSCIKH